MADLLSGGAVGAGTGEVLKHVLLPIKKGREFGPTLETNIETLKALAPIVEEMKGYNDLLDRPREEIERLETHIREGEELVRKSKKLNRWKFLRFPHYQTKLKKKDEDLRRRLTVNVQVENRRDLMEVLTHVKEILEILDQFHENQVRKNGVGVSVLAMIGSGKFGGNIFIATLSITPNLKRIVGQLFEHCGYSIPKFTSEEDAINRLRVLLGRNPMLLVLDGVWPGSEGLVDKFKFQTSDFKILVTSRVQLTRFGTPYQLSPLDHHHAASLYRDEYGESSPHKPEEPQVLSL
ncbi:hypothetical protein RYX36_003651 [Vicia faba]